MFDDGCVHTVDYEDIDDDVIYWAHIPPTPKRVEMQNITVKAKFLDNGEITMSGNPIDAFFKCVEKGKEITLTGKFPVEID